MIVTRTPLRISFFGGGTDYPVWYRKHGGAVLSTTIDKSCYITTRWLPPFFEYHSRISYSKVENVSSNSKIEHPSVRACLEHLGTSSAFTVGFLLGLYALKNQMRDKQALTAEAIHVERDLLQEAVGAQDQASCAYGGFNRINVHTNDAIEVNRILAAPSRLAELEQHLALYFTGFARTASEIAKAQLKATPNRQKELTEMLQMVDEAEDIVTNPNRSLDEFGKLLHQGWQLKRSLTEQISNSSIDEIYEAGRSAGALGGKLLGAGGGGFMLFYVPPERRQAVRMRLKNLLCIPFAFSSRGSDVAVYEPEMAYDKSLATDRSEIYAQRG
jgi:D-glycero-alpha-D-manno-heptose-7-phosphate kinase